MPEDVLYQKLAQGVTDLGLTVEVSQKEKLIRFIGLIEKWNKTHNLTAIESLDEMVVKHLLDSLSLLPHLDNNELLDVGAGAGLPSIPLAIANSDLNCTALDASYKRTVFMRTVARELGLSNLTIVHSKVEAFQSNPFPAICSRAFSSLKDFVLSTEHLLQENGCWLAMKGQEPEAEIDDLPLNACIVNELALHVPGLDAQRRLIVLQKVADTYETGDTGSV